jgi:hypothetical protein
MTEEQIRRKIEGILFNWILAEKPISNISITKQILSIKGIRIEAEKQELPEPNMDIHLWRDYSPDEAYEKAQQDMLKEGWIKCLKKEEHGTR